MKMFLQRNSLRNQDQRICKLFLFFIYFQDIRDKAKVGRREEGERQNKKEKKEYSERVKNERLKENRVDWKKKEDGRKKRKWEK